MSKNPPDSDQLNSPVGGSVPAIIPSSTPNKIFKPDGSVDEQRFFDIIGNDIRRKILSKLSKFPRFASDLAIDLGVSKQAVKKHLDKLVGYGIVKIAQSSQTDKKKQFYEICPDVALFSQIDLTPNYFSLSVSNHPEKMTEIFEDEMHHNPQTAVTSSSKVRIDYQQLNFALNSLGSQLHAVEKKIDAIEANRKDILIKKTVLINRIQLIINSLVESDLEKDVIFSLFFDTKSTVEGLTLNEILSQLFLRKRKRAGVSKYKYVKTDQKTLDRGKELLDLIQMMIKNFGFIREEDMKLYFDFNNGHSEL